MFGILLLIGSAVVVSESFARIHKHGPQFIKLLHSDVRLKNEHLPRMRRAFTVSKTVFGVLAAGCVIAVLFPMASGTLPSISFVCSTSLLLLIWASLQFPGSTSVELRSFSALFVFTVTFPWLILIVDQIVQVHPSVLFGFSRPLVEMGIEHPSSIQLAWFVTLFLTSIALSARLAVALMFSLPALLFGYLVRAKLRLLGDSQQHAMLWGVLGAVGCALGAILSW